MTALQTGPLHDPKLRELADTANAEHRLVEEAQRDALTHAMNAGEALNAAKHAIGWGHWLDWLGEHFEATPQTARLYMRISRHREEIVRAGVDTLNKAEQYLRVFAAEAVSRQEEARQMRDEGMSIARIARHFDVSTTSVYHWLSPTARAAKSRSAQRRRAAAAALRREQRDQAVRSVGGDVAKSYVQVRRLAATLRHASEQERSKEARRALETALLRLYAVEDEIVRAVRLSHPELRSTLTAKRGD